MLKHVVAIAGTCVCVLALSGEGTAADRRLPAKRQKQADVALKAYEKLPEEVRSKLIEAWYDRAEKMDDLVASAKREAQRMPANKRKARMAEIAEQERAFWSNDPPYVPQLDLGTVGAIGTLNYTADESAMRFVLADQVIDEDEVLVTPGYTTRGTNSLGLPSGPYEDNVTDPLWLRGVPTSGLVDGQRMELKGTFRIVGTKRYETAAGATNTVPIVEPFDVGLLLSDEPLPEPKLERDGAG